MTVLFARLVLYCIGGGFAPDFSTHVVPRLAGANMGHPSKGGRLWEPWDLGGRRGALQIPPLRSPGFPVELGGADALHAPFLTERRIRCLVQCCVTGNPGSFGRDDKGEGSASIQIGCCGG